METTTKSKKTITSQHGKFDKLALQDAKKKGIDVPKPAKDKKSSQQDKKAKQKATDKNIATAAKKSDKDSTERESKYIYPADCKTASQKKEFRRKARATDKKYLSDLKKLKKATDAEGTKLYEQTKKEASKWRKGTYVSVKEGPTAE